MPINRRCEFVGTRRKDQHIDRLVVFYDLKIIPYPDLLFLMSAVILRPVLVPDPDDRARRAER